MKTGNDIIKELLSEGTPFCAGKIGNSELVAMMHYVRAVPLHPAAKQMITVNAGVFPDRTEVIYKFFRIFQESLKELDVCAEWPEEAETLLRMNNEHASMVSLRSLEPFYFESPWSSELKGKKVIVINSFAKTIESQYNNRTKLWENENILPEFDLKTIQSPYLSLDQGEDKDWFDAFDRLYGEASESKPDIVIVGAGAYSLPLIAKFKQDGVSGIHMGGGTQILFGIKGKRWDEHDEISSFYNEHWVRPNENEVPNKKDLIEGGCYW
jgi:hypothetical protein